MQDSALSDAQIQATSAEAGPSSGFRVAQGEDANQNFETEAGSQEESDEDADTEDQTHYRLFVEQNPSRGRTCGFGDADRRALSAPLILRLRAYLRRDDTEHEIDASDIDTTFLVCCADLWSADASKEENLVHHPSYSQRPPNTSQSNFSYSRPTTMDNGAPVLSKAALPERPSTASVSPSSRHVRPFTAPKIVQQTSRPLSNAPISTLPSPYSSSALQQSEIASSIPGGLPMPFPANSPTSGTFAFQAPSASYVNQSSPNFSEKPSAYPFDSSVPHGQLQGTSPILQRTMTAAPSKPTTSSSFGPTSAGPAPLESNHPQNALACVKNLVGALTTVGHRLLAPNETSEGIFFVFHDLSVRTEGTFTIRLRLVSIGSLLTGMSKGPNTILAEAFTAPFEVMSAKRFPGMLDPTPLSQAFAKQGLRIPTRKGANRKRRRTSAHRGAANVDEAGGDLEEVDDSSV